MSAPSSFFETSFFVDGRATTAAEFNILLNGSVPFTVSAWINARSVQDAADILIKPGVFRFGLQGIRLYVEINGFPDLWSDGVTNPITQGGWQYVACVFTGSALQIYVDGNLDCSAGVGGQGFDNTDPFVIANNLEGSLNSVRIYDSALTGAAILEAMYQPDPTQAYVANFDFTLNPPAETSGNDLPLDFSGKYQVSAVTPAVALTAGAYCQPIADTAVNPGGAGDDPYSIQAWIFVSNPTATLTADGLEAATQAVFVNQLTDGSAGVGLILVYDATVDAYRLASFRGNTNGTMLISQGTVPYGQWINVAVTYDFNQTTLSLYIGGALDSSGEAFDSITALEAPGILIGGEFSATMPTPVSTFQGYIQTVDVWSKALSATEIQTWLTGYPILESGLLAHYDFTTRLTRNELDGTTIGLADRADVRQQTSAADASTASAPTTARRRPPMAEEPYYKQLSPDVMGALREGISFADCPELDSLLEQAAERELSQNLHHLFPAAMVPGVRARLSDEWARVRRLMRENPLELPYLVTYHKLDGEHILIHHTPVRSTVVYRAPLEALDDCTMWRIRVFFLMLMAVLSVGGITASLGAKVQDFMQQRVFNNIGLMLFLGTAGPPATALTLYCVIKAFYEYGILWPFIKTVLLSLSWWALGKLLLKILLKFFSGPLALAEALVAIVVAVAQMIYLLTQQPASCPLIPVNAQVDT